MRKPILQTLFFSLFSVTVFMSCNNDPSTGQGDDTDTSANQAPNIKEEMVDYAVDTVNMKGFVAYDANKDGKRPVVIVVHEWWGLTDYVKDRARQLAEMGYLAMAVDMYGGGKTASNPGDAEKFATPFYQDPQMAKRRFDAGLLKAISFPQADTSKIAAIGYCFGGSMVLNVAKLGEDIEGVVSFHGGLAGVAPQKELLKAKVLVCHGAADSFVSQQEVEEFRKQMDSVGADYTFISYPDATHAFTNPESTSTGRKFSMPISYHPAADSASWKDMRDFFGRIFR